MKQKLQSLLVIFGLLWQVNMQAQIKYPVSISNFNVNPSVFLSDYTTPGSGNIKASLKFNDYNEASTNVYLNISIEGPNAKLVTSPSFRPTEMITLIPGELYTLQDMDFTPYFMFQNLQCQGISQAELQRTDQLPEGWYTFTIQVFDMTSGKALSQPMSTRANLMLIDPPTLFTPEKGKFIKTNLPQITFQWQQNAHAVLSKLQIDYYLRLYEIPEGEDPLVAMQNKSARQIFQSTPINGKTYNYGISDVPLESGKRYAYTITAQDANGRKWFKNNGVSEAGWFYYGYPTGGKISLTYPANEEALNRKMIQKLEWAANNNLVDNSQPVKYYVKIVKIEADEDPKTAMENSATWEKETGEILNKSGFSVTLPTIGSEERYAWQVKAFTDGVEVGKSDVQTFYSPPALEEFVAGFGHIIEVSKLNNVDLTDLSGKGMVKISASGKKIEVWFEHIKVENIAGLMLMTGGEIKCSVEGLMDPIPLTPSSEVNDKAICYPDSICINGEGMFIKGRVEWDYPFGTTSKEKSKVKFQPTWFNFNDNYRLSGTPQIMEEQGYNLLEPAKFFMKLNNESYAYVFRDQWEMVFSGQIFVAENVKGTQRENYSIDFKDLRQLHYNVIENYENSNEIRLIANTKLNLVPRTVIVDLSEEQSPVKFSDQPDWKGIYFENFDLRFIPEVDDKGQIKLTHEIFNNYTLSSSDSCKSWIIGDGLHFLFATQVAEEGIVQFNTFPSKIDLLSINIEKSAVKQAGLKGSIRVPVISQTDRYSYSVPITNAGFQTGYLDKSLDGLNFVFNEGSKEQKIYAKVKRAVFANQDHLDMDLEMKWDEIGVTFTDLQQFCAWGNYEIGFVKPKGVANLTNQIQGHINDYKINVEQIGCGRMCNQYSFASAASVVIDADISGPKGAPKLNFYSIADNSLLTGPCDLPEQNIETTPRFENIGHFAMTDEGVGEMSEDKTAEEIEALNAEISAKTKAINSVGETIYSLTTNVSFSQENVAGNLFANMQNNISSNAPFDLSAENLTLSACISLVESMLKFVKLPDDEDKKIKQILSTVKSLESNACEVKKFIADVKSGAIFETIIDMGVDYAIDKTSAPLIKIADKAKNGVTKGVDNLQTKVLTELDLLMLEFLDALRAGAKNGIVAISNSQDAGEIIDESLKKTSEELRATLKSAIKESVDKNITKRVTGLIDTVLYVRIVAFLSSELRDNMKNLILHKGEGISIQNTATNAENMLDLLADDISNFISIENLSTTLTNTGKDILNAFNWGEIGMSLVVDIGERVGVNMLANEGTKALVEKFNTGVAGEVLGNIADNVSIDFDALKKGNFKDAIKFDPSHISISSKVLKGAGYMEKLKDDPVYGDVFKAGINAMINVPKPFNVFANFISGKELKENIDYWFVEFGCRQLGLSMTPVPLVFDGGEGRVFKHMSRADGKSPYVPDKNNEFGAGIKAYFYDQSGGGVAVFDVDFEMTIEKEGFRLKMLGDASLGNVMKDGEVSKSIATGYGEMGYSNIDNIFYAKAGIKLGTAPILCGGGEFNAFISPDTWSVSIGTRANPVYASLLCMDNFRMDSWLYVDKTLLDVGLHQLVNIEARTPQLNLGFGKFDAYGKFHYEFGVESVVYWKPLRVKDASIYMDIAFAVGIGYDCPWPIGSGDLDLLSVGFGGNLIYMSRTAEEMRALLGTSKEIAKYTGAYSCLSGKLYGHVTVIGFGINLEMNAKKEWFG